MAGRYCASFAAQYPGGPDGCRRDHLAAARKLEKVGAPSRCFAYGSTSGENQQGVIDLVTVLECRERVQRARDARLVAFGASAALAAGIAGLPGARLQPFEVVEHEQVGGRAISVAKPSTPASPISGSACWRGARDRSAAPSARRRSRVARMDRAAPAAPASSLDPNRRARA